MEKRKIPAWNPLLLTDMVDADPTPNFDLDVELYMPDDLSRPVPGVVVSEGLGGLHDSRERGYGRKLSAEGYAVVVINSFRARGVEQNGDVIRALTVTESMMLGDAFAGLRFLAEHPAVDESRVGVIGFSYGGMITVLTSYEQLARLYLPNGPRFATHVSYYGCSIPRLDDPATTGAPVAMLLGEWDRNVSLPRSHEIAEDLRRGGSKSDVRIFESVYHQWDGEDEKRRFVPFNLRSLHMRVSRDYAIKDERTGFAMRSRRSRTALIGMWTNPLGYMIRRDDDATTRSDEILFERLQAM